MEARTTLRYEPTAIFTARPQPMFETEIVSAAEAVPHADAWRRLASHCLEPNIFFEAEFALAALAHLRGRERARVIFVWAGAPRRLVGVLPIRMPRSPFGCCFAWVHNQSVLGVPLLDQSCAEAAFTAMQAAVMRAWPRHPVLLLPLIPKAGPTFALLERLAAAQQSELGAELELFGVHERAVLTPPFVDPLSGGAAMETRRQRRRLAEAGSLLYRRRQDPAEIPAAMEEFLALEAQGWKGRKRTALAGAPDTAAFARSLARNMAGVGAIAVDSLELAGRAIAMGIVLRSGTRAFFWKIAYDESYATRSPGVLFTQDLTHRQIADAHLSMTDSCAKPNHSMIDRLWPGRLALADVALPLQGSRTSIDRALFTERLRRTILRTIKSALTAARQKSRR